MTAATDDRTVDCPHRVECGACSLLRQSYGTQLERKRRWLMDALDGVVNYDIRQVLPTLPSPQVEGYRNRAKMTISSHRDRRWRLGYFKPGGREVLDAQHCPVLMPQLVATTRALRELLNSSTRIPFSWRHIDLRAGSDPTRQHLTLVVKSDTVPQLPTTAIANACPQVAGIAVNLNPSSGPQVVKGHIEAVTGVREVYVDSSGLRLRVSPGSFFQVNLGILPEIHTRMASFLGEGNLLVDLYAGVGTHGLALRHQFRRVLCVEGVRGAVADARATVKAGHVEAVEILASPIHRALRRLGAEKPAAVILNPSRAGADRPALAMITASSARRLAYLSCDPSTLARDLALLMDGGFELTSVQAVDMMPQTRQVEALALLER